MSAPFDAGARALFEDTMAGRFESAAQRPGWDEVDEDERAGWRATVKAIVEAEQGGELERLRTDLRNVQRNTAQYVQHARAEVVEANKRAAEATRRADATAEANRRLLAAFENPTAAIGQTGEVVAWRERDGDEWVYYDADSNTGQHIAAYQRDRHNVSVFPLIAALVTQEGNCPKIPDSSIAATSQQSEEGTALGEVQCACSDDDGVPDVGVSVGLGNGKALWIGETLLRDGSNIGVVFHGPDQQRIVAPLPDETDWQAIGDIIRHHVAPALAAIETREAEGTALDDYDYNQLWDAIAKATRIDGGIIAISVRTFRAVLAGKAPE